MGNPGLGPLMASRFPVFADTEMRLSSWGNRPCTANLHSVLLGHGHCTLRSSRGTGKMMLICLPCPGAMGVLLLPGTPSAPHKLLTYISIDVWILDCVWKANPPYMLEMCQTCNIWSRVLIKNNHHEVRLPSTQSLDNGNAMTCLFHLFLCDLSCRVCKAK